ncbi:MAG TPA: O-antigen ligase family protein [Thermoanaerobaculia bacterium]|jgi:hypothetical protein|nr:O-antigen ligase family protein [Thermoanaerobaculia bacterium]
MRNGIAALARPAGAIEQQSGAMPGWIVQLGFIAVHVPLAVAIPKHSRLGTFYALAVFGIGLILAVLPRKSHLVACAGAYITGAAVFWRMRAAPNIPWEFGKYAVIAIFAVALVASVRIRRAGLPVAYLALLLPSVFLTVSSAPWDDAKEMLSFNMSGPILLALSVLFFSSIRLTPAQMRWVAVSVLAPIVSIATVAAVSLQAALEDPDFAFYGGSSNAATSGGFGPNQVSAILGLGIVAILVYFIAGKMNGVLTGAMLLLTLFLVRQCLITLSRGGVYMSLGAVAAASYYLLQDRTYRSKLLIAGGVLAVILAAIVIPRLEAITGGVLVSRFENTSGTGRDLLIKGDLDSWSASPLLGVGPGMGGAARLKYFNVPTAHTEYTRMFAEHGLLGFISLILLGAMAVRSVREQRTLRAKAMAAALLAYALLFMAVDAMRFGAPAFAFGLAGVSLIYPKRRDRMPAALDKAPRLKVAVGA